MRAQKRAGAIVHLPFVLRVVLLAADPLCVAEIEPPGSALESAVAALHLGDGEDVRATDDHGGGVFTAGAFPGGDHRDGHPNQKGRLRHVVLGQVVPLDHGAENLDVVRSGGVPAVLDDLGGGAVVQLPAQPLVPQVGAVHCPGEVCAVVGDGVLDAGVHPELGGLPDGPSAAGLRRYPRHAFPGPCGAGPVVAGEVLLHPEAVVGGRGQRRPAPETFNDELGEGDCCRDAGHDVVQGGQRCNLLDDRFVGQILQFFCLHGALTFWRCTSG